MSMRLRFARLSLFEQPLLLVAVAFVCGLLFAAKTRISLDLWMAPGVLSWVAGVTGIWRKFEYPVTVALLVCGCFAAGGMLWAINEAGGSDHSVRRLFESGALKLDEPIEVWG